MSEETPTAAGVPATVVVDKVIEEKTKQHKCPKCGEVFTEGEE